MGHAAALRWSKSGDLKLSVRTLVNGMEHWEFPSRAASGALAALGHCGDMCTNNHFTQTYTTFICIKQ